MLKPIDFYWELVQVFLTLIWRNPIVFVYVQTY